MLGLSYARGEGVAQDAKQAVAWYRKAAKQGNAEAQLMLGASYAIGEGVTQDAIQAYVWFSVAAANGNSNAKKNRDFVANTLSRSELANAQKLAGQYFEIYQSGS